MQFRPCLCDRQTGVFLSAETVTNINLILTIVVAIASGACVFTGLSNAQMAGYAAIILVAIIGQFYFAIRMGGSELWSMLFLSLALPGIWGVCFLSLAPMFGPEQKEAAIPIFIWSASFTAVGVLFEGIALLGTWIYDRWWVRNNETVVHS